MKNFHVRGYFIALQNCFASFKRGSIFSLFLLYALVQIAFVLMLMFFAYPPFSAFLVPLMTKIFGEPSLHYPNNFAVLPSLFFWVNLILSGFLGIVMVGASTNMFSKNFENKSVALGSGLKATWPHYAVLLVVWFVETAVLMGIFMSVPSLLAKIEFFSGYGPLMKQLVTSMIAIVFGSLFIYTSALVVLDGKGPFGAIGESFKMFGRYPFITIALMAIPNLIKMPLDMLTSKTQLLITKFNPEMVAGVIILGVLVSVFSNFLLVGSVTRYFMLSKEGLGKGLA